jgi:hypothetical protein
MADELPDALREQIGRKIFPRNLTAGAAYEAPGNPPTSRPESGPDNCFPGLDFDQRNLERAFFPGLRFEFSLGDDGAIVTHIGTEGPPADIGLKMEDVPLFLWALGGRISEAQSNEEPPTFKLSKLDGLNVWARVHDLIGGPVGVLLGPEPVRISGVPDDGMRALRDALKSGQSRLMRHENGRVKWAAVAADRARYLDEAGVIDPARYEPGELTLTLCSPWQYDFRDCGCFYWAASKPDIVSSGDGKQPYAFYLRKDRGPFPPADRPTFARDREDALDYAELLAGEWETKLPIVLDDREANGVPRSPAPLRKGKMSHIAIAEELRYLATVEHALCVQYLYAHYSLDAPPVLRSGVPIGDDKRRIFAAADEILQVAKDEMRHLRWVNEMLMMLPGQPDEGPVVELGRATIIGRQLRQEFQLLPLTAAQLDWFIKVEEPSKAPTPDGVDGMYVQLLASIEADDSLSGRARLVHLIKLIIDEGDNHYKRFRRVKEHLEGIPEARYLRIDEVTKNPEPDERQRWLLDQSDSRYREMLTTLKLMLTEGDRGGGIFLEQSKRDMHSMHEINHLLASQGFGPRFAMPDQS